MSTLTCEGLPKTHNEDRESKKQQGEVKRKEVRSRNPRLISLYLRSPFPDFYKFYFQSHIPSLFHFFFDEKEKNSDFFKSPCIIIYQQISITNRTKIISNTQKYATNKSITFCYLWLNIQGSVVDRVHHMHRQASFQQALQFCNSHPSLPVPSRKIKMSVQVRKSLERSQSVR